MEKLVTETYWRMDDGRMLFRKVVHTDDKTWWMIKDLEAEHFRAITEKETIEFILGNEFLAKSE